MEVGGFSLPCVTLISGQDTYNSFASKGIVKSACVRVEGLWGYLENLKHVFFVFFSAIFR